MIVDPPLLPHVFSQSPWPGTMDVFPISRRHADQANMAFLDIHVEHGSL